MPKLAESTRTRLVSATRLAALVVLGVLAGFALWICSAFVLGMAGLYMYGLVPAFFLAFVIWLIGAPIAYFRLRGRGAEYRRGLLTFLAGMLAFHLYSCVGVVIEAPQSIPWPR